MVGRKVVVVGAGVGGPVLGMWLERAGIEVELYEARERTALREGAFLGLAPNGMNVLEALGLAERVAAIGYGCSAFRFINRKEKALGTIDRSGDMASFGHPLTMVRRGELHALLVEEAERRGVPIRFGARLTALEAGGEGVVCRFADGGSAVCDAVIGCDGLRSTVRALAFPEAKSPAFTGLWDYGGFVPAGARIETPFLPCVNGMLFGKRAFFGVFTTPTGETWWFHNGPPNETVSPRDALLWWHRDDPSWVRELIEATPEVLGPWPIHEVPPMKRWSRGRVCLIGDAAHAMSPSAGQGASLAIEDAMVLSRCLRDETNIASAFETFERSRRARVDAIFEMARRSGSGKAPANRVSEMFRDLMLPMFLRFGAREQTRMYAERFSWEGAAPPRGGEVRAS